MGIDVDGFYYPSPPFFSLRSIFPSLVSIILSILLPATVCLDDKIEGNRILHLYLYK